MVSVLTLIAADRGFESRKGQTEYKKFVASPLSMQH